VRSLTDAVSELPQAGKRAGVRGATRPLGWGD